MEFDEFYEALGHKIMEIIRTNNFPFKVSLLKNEIKGMGLFNPITNQGKGYDFKRMYDECYGESSIDEIAQIIVQDAIQTVMFNIGE